MDGRRPEEGIDVRASGFDDWGHTPRWEPKIKLHPVKLYHGCSTIRF